MIKKEAYITSVCIIKDYRGLGLGDILIEKAIKLAKSKGFIRINLELGKLNLPAISLYKKFGFNKTIEKSETIIMTYEFK